MEVEHGIRAVLMIVEFVDMPTVEGKDKEVMEFNSMSQDLAVMKAVEQGK